MMLKTYINTRTLKIYRVLLFFARVRLATLLFCGTACATSASPARVMRVGGWVNYWNFAPGMKVVEQQAPRLSDVFLFVAQLESSGRPTLVNHDADYAKAAADIRRMGSVPWLTIVNDVQSPKGEQKLKSTELTHIILATADQRTAHCTDIVSLARRLNVAGVDIDYENIAFSDRNAFSALIVELAEQLHRAGLQLSVTVQPKRSESTALGPGAADWQALCKVADRLQIMMYNEHNARTPPGPIASVAFIESVMRYATSQCAPEKLVAAIKVGGMSWGSRDPFRDMSHTDSVRALALADPTSIHRNTEDAVPNFNYVDKISGDVRTVYYEDALSMQKKYEALQRFNIKDIVLWSLSNEDPNFWQVSMRD